MSYTSGTATAASIVAGAQTAAAILAAASAGGSGGAGGILSGLFHSGGIVGSGGAARMMPAIAFANAPRLHAGGFDTQAIGDYLATAEGEKVVLNIVSRNRSTLGGG